MIDEAAEWAALSLLGALRLQLVELVRRVQEGSKLRKNLDKEFAGSL